MNYIAPRRAQADSLTEQVRLHHERLSALLKESLTVEHALNWEGMIEGEHFIRPKPESPSLPVKPSAPPLPREPQLSDSSYLPVLGFLDSLIPSRQKRRIEEMKTLFSSDHDLWQSTIASVNQAYEKLLPAT
jgi:hypothetical protein